MEVLSNWIVEFQSISLLIRLLITAGLFIVFYIINKTFSLGMDKSKRSSQQILKSKRLFANINRLMFIIFVIPVWIGQNRDAFAFLGLFSAGIAFAFRDMLASFLGWVVLTMRQPFQIGDRVMVGKLMGDVIEISWFYTTLIEVEGDQKKYGQSTGRFIYVPNIKILIDPVINETKTFPYIWNEMHIHLTKISEWQQAKKIMILTAQKNVGGVVRDAERALKEAEKNKPIKYQKLTPAVYTSIEGDKIVLTLRFLCRSRNVRNLEHKIYEALLVEFKKHGNIELAHPNL